MNKKTKKILSLILTSVMMFSSSLTVFAKQEDNIKEEIVYVMLDENGKSNTVYVVNSYPTFTGGSLVDYGNYKSLRNLSTSDILKNENGVVTSNISKGKFYYEGTMASAEIPWDISIIYKLDGNITSAYDLASSQGNLEIEINISENKDFSSKFYENYALQISTSMDTNKSNNITAPGATISNVGENKNISYTLLPGKNGVYKISADVTNFEMGAISINGVP
ncbi:MAG: hypothetical protein N2B06_00225, partial [Clostridium sp.]